MSGARRRAAQQIWSAIHIHRSSKTESSYSQRLLDFPYLALQQRGVKVNGSDVKLGNIIEKNGRLYEVIKAQHTQHERGGATIQGQVHRHAHKFREVQQCTLLSIKTRGCSEDCSYCPQSSRYDTGVKGQKLMNKDAVIESAKKAKEAGSTRFCMGAAWRDTVGRKTNFNQILDYVKEIRGLGMEVCCTLGMLEKQQAEDLKKAGLTAYNHNLDTSREFYPSIITTRSYDERLKTLEFVREAGISVCSGGIIGLGEQVEDRVGLLHTLATLREHPESVPINALLAVKGTPLQDQKPVEIWEMIRMIATARIVMPKAMVRLSAGRVRFSLPEQGLCFLAGANSIFTGEKLLTTPNNDFDADQRMFKLLGLIPKAASIVGEIKCEAKETVENDADSEHDEAAAVNSRC